MRDWFRFLGWAALAVLTFAILWIFIIPLFVASKYADRTVQRFDAETSAQVYDTSRQYQQGTNRDIARYCEQMRSASTPAARQAVSALIRSTVSTYDGPLSDDNRQCVLDAQAH